MEWFNLNMHEELVYIDKLEDSTELVLAFCFWFDMGDSGKSNKMSRTEMESFSNLDASRFSRDFLTRFMGISGSREAGFEHDDDDDNNNNDNDEIELNLGLSLGGRFGVDKSSCKNKLIRSSSIAACLPVVRDDDAAVAASSVPPVTYSSLVRTSSLPVETEEEWRKRKELQTLRRMEAKRRRSEKQRNMMKSDQREGGGGVSTGEEEKKDSTEREQQWLAAAKRFSSSVVAAPPPLGGATSRHSVLRGGFDVPMSKGKGTILGTTNLGQLLMSQGSVESQGGSFSSEMDSKSLQGTGSSSCSDLSPGSIQSSSKGNEQELGSSSRTKTKGTCLTTEMDNQLRKSDTMNRGGKESSSKKDTLEEMPCVFTKGDGPNGKRVDGILYKYGKGEEVRIMCVCHGNFLSPAEFIKHAGGTDVTHPLKHIVVNPNASPFP